MDKRKKGLVLVAIGIVLVLILLSGIGLGLFIKDILFGKEPTLKKPSDENSINVLFLHHSTGKNIWDGGVPEWFDDHNKNNDTKVEIIEQDFPKSDPYGWNNYPYDYWNIWVNNAGEEPYKNEPTLEMITKDYDVVVFKHCFPVSSIKADTGEPQIDSSDKRAENYKLQYEALKEKINTFPDTKFIVWTGAALVRENTDEASAERARNFSKWVKEEWDIQGNNIYIWDFRELQTEGGLYFKDEYALNSANSHPNEEFSERVAPLLCERIIEVIDT